MARKRLKLNNFFTLSWRKAWIAVVLGFVSILLHNGVYALFGFEEPLFLLIAVGVPFYLVIAIVYSLIKSFK